MATPLTPDDPASLGAYRLAGRLGKGGQGVVYLAHSRDGEAVAIKLLSTGDQETRARLARELDALESIASFCTARVLDVSIEGPRPYVVSEFVEGLSLADRARERGPLRGGELERLVVGTATALAAIHAAGVVHRDFKPANVLLGPDGPRVVDFGIARAEGAATMTSGLIGTPAYLSPEQIAGSPAAPASDVFAWAATMVFAATGRSPFGADTVPAVLHRVLQANPDLSELPPRLRGLMASCLSKDPAHRPTARDLMVSLVNPTSTPPAPPQGFPTGAPGGAPGTGGIPGTAGAPDTGRVPGTGAGERTGPRAAALTTDVSRRNRSRGLLIGALAAVLALAAAGGTLLWINRTPTGTGAQTSTSHTPRASTTAEKTADQATEPTRAATEPTPTPSQATSTEQQPQSGSLKIPSAFAGKWSGHITSTNPLDSDGADNTIELQTGRSTAQWESKDASVSCTGKITLTKVAGTKLTFTLQPDTIDCIAGTVWLTLDGDKLTYLWRDVPGPGLVEETGELSRS
ncbi:serine/threonine-protein kinase [Nonomuraea sp. NEAU-A123]|uniref:serine/threonine-protein kinase n=1 Tax=Nonomuraea sp. NEAU-A123 TaxID=2839649 RepID=UPI001BE40325|nr:serine/threonine-protein kinase [Nonomuraea sp. NEAU-A123]MBT2232944.1 protein kinase [Nonomuraea sp. NEAU-A123]